MHTYAHTRACRPIVASSQDQLYVMCECAQHGVCMHVVQMVSSHRRAPSLRSPTVPPLASSGTSYRVLGAAGWEGGTQQIHPASSTRAGMSETHTHTHHPHMFRVGSAIAEVMARLFSTNEDQMWARWRQQEAVWRTAR